MKDGKWRCLDWHRPTPSAAGVVYIRHVFAGGSQLINRAVDASLYAISNNYSKVKSARDS